MKIIKLHGPLRQYGASWRLDVKTPAEAVRAIMVQSPGFRRHLLQHNAPGYRVWVGDEVRDLARMHEPFSQVEVLRIVPVARGASGDGLFGIILGVGMIALGGAGFFTTALSGLGASASVATSIATGVAAAGWGLVIGGVASMLFKPSKPELSVNERPENKPSYMFNGAVNTAAQGGCVPVCYGGPIIVGSARVSAGLFSQGIEP